MARDENETIVDAYFHSSPARLLDGNIEEELHLIIENFALQIDEYTNMRSGLKLFQVNQCSGRDLGEPHYNYWHLKR